MTLSSQPIPVADLLTRAAHEIGLCRAMVSTVEHAVEHLHDQGSYPDLQGLDLLDQMLGDIAALLRAIAETNAFAPAGVLFVAAAGNCGGVGVGEAVGLGVLDDGAGAGEGSPPQPVRETLATRATSRSRDFMVFLPRCP